MKHMIRATRVSLSFIIFAVSALAQETEAPREGGLTGTGIVVLINEAGNVEINGRILEIPANVPMSGVLGPASTDTLQPGDTVAATIQASGEGWTAESVHQLMPIVGPVSEETDTTLTVMGATITRPDAAISVNEDDWVAVSGFWSEDGVVATRLEVIAPQAFAQIQGTYRQIEAGDGRIGESQIRFAPPVDVNDGDVIQVIGTPSEDGIEVQSVEVGLFDVPVQAMLAQGYLSIPDQLGNYSLLGSGIRSRTEQPEMINPQTFVTMCGLDGELVEFGQADGEATHSQTLLKLGCFNFALD